MIVRVLRKADGGVTRTVVSYGQHDGHQAITEIERLQQAYPEHGHDPEQGYGARDAAGLKYTFEAN